MKIGSGRWVMAAAAALFLAACGPVGPAAPAGVGDPAGPVVSAVEQDPTAQVVEAPSLGSGLLRASVSTQDSVKGQEGTAGGAAEVPAQAEAPAKVEVPGAVTGMVADLSAGGIRYLVITPPGAGMKEVLLPWGAFSMTQPDPLEAAQEGGGKAEDFRPMVTVNLPAVDLAEAPEIKGAVLEKIHELSPAWEAGTRGFWAGKITGVDAAAGEDPSSSAGSLAYLRGGADGLALDVINAAGEKIGQVHDLVIDPDGTLAFAVMSLPKLPEMGGERLVVDWQQARWDLERRSLLIETPAATLRAAPRFDAEALPDTTIPGWDKDWQEFWSKASGVEITAVPEDGLVQLQVSQLLGLTVLDPNAAELGVVEDLILGQEGAISYLVVRVGDLLRPVPWADFEFDLQKGLLTYLDDVARLNEAPGFALPADLDTALPEWDEEIRAYWGIGR